MGSVAFKSSEESDRSYKYKFKHYSAKAIMEKIEKKIKLLGYLLGDTGTSSTVIGDEIFLYTTELSINPPTPQTFVPFWKTILIIKIMSSQLSP